MKIRSRSFALILLLLPIFILIACFNAQAAPHQRETTLTLLDEVGRLAHPVTTVEVVGWRNDLHTGKVIGEEAAKRQLWLGEWELAKNESPVQAAWHFALARNLSVPTHPCYGLATYDNALALFYEGAYAKATEAFRHMLSGHTGMTGIEGRTCALWLRHAGACAGYHTAREALGIVEPKRLDPLCGVEALAACLRGRGLSYDKKTVLSRCRVTGEGSSLKDLMQAGTKLGANTYCIRADTQGLMALPKPLVAFVEHDHFIAVIDADKSGVTYLCSDCGSWPGGRQHLSWKQWRAMDAGLYMAAVLPNSLIDQALQQLPAQPSQVSARLATKRRQCLRPQALNHLSQMITLLKSHVVQVLTPFVDCGIKPESIHKCKQCAPMDHSPTPGASPHHADPVNLATGEEEYTPDPDLVVYNPMGPSVAWTRRYNSLRNNFLYTSFGYGWADNYNVRIQTFVDAASANISLTMDNGAQFHFTTNSIPTVAVSTIICTPQDGGNEFLLVWRGNITDGSDSFALVHKDHTQWVFKRYSASHRAFVGGGGGGGTPPSDGYVLDSIIDRNNNAITFVYNGAGLYQIQNSGGSVLLTIGVDAHNNINQITDIYGRIITYDYASYNQGYTTQYELTQVNQVTTDPTIRNYRYKYEYTYCYVFDTTNPYLHTIQVPSPQVGGTSIAEIDYSDGSDNQLSTGLVKQTIDASGNKRVYDFTQAQESKVSVYDATGKLNYQYSADFDTSMNETARKDIKGNILSSMIYDSTTADPYRSLSSADAYNPPTTRTWDQYGNMLTETVAHGTPNNYHYTTTHYIYHYPTHFEYGQLYQVWTDGQQATTYHYSNDANSSDTRGLLIEVDAPAPGTTLANPGIVAISYTYTALGNVRTMTKPGPNGNTITTTYGYIDNVQTTEALDEPVAITVADVSNMQSPILTTTRHYNTHGQIIAAIDALGHETDYAYNGLTDQKTDVFYPKSSSNAANQSYTHTDYNLYVGGPPTDTIVYDESSTPNPIREVDYTYNVDGAMLTVSGSAEPVTYTYDALYRIATLKDGNAHVTHYYYNARGYLDSIIYPGYAPDSGYSNPPAFDNVAGVYRVSGKDSVRFQQAANGTPAPAYNLNGETTQRIDGNGTVTQYQYNDVENQPTGIIYGTGNTLSVTLTYDPTYGRLMSESDTVGTYGWTYDDLELPQTETTQYKQQGTVNQLPAWTLKYAYNPDGSRLATTLSGGTTYNFSYGYDAVGRPLSLNNPASQSFTWAYLQNAQHLSNSWLSTVTAKSGSLALYQSAYTYNGRGWLTDLRTRNSYVALSEFGSATSPMQYDATGNRTGLNVSMPTATSGAAGYFGAMSYAYDANATSATAQRGQLTSENDNRFTGASGGFTYDAAGNPTTFHGVTNPAFNADNQPGGNTYDGNGSPTAYNGATCAFDAERRLTSMSRSQFNAGYRADGLRAWKSGLQTAPPPPNPNAARANTSVIVYTAPVTYFLYDGGHVIAELDSNGNAKAVNTWGPTGLLARQNISGTNAGTSSVYTYDPSGNVAQRLDGSGNVVGSYGFDAFGKEATNDTTPDPYQYGGRWGYYTDSETGLTLCGHRYYDSSNGRWLTRDPLEYNGGINLYTYCYNNAVNLSDPNGQFGSSTTTPFGVATLASIAAEEAGNIAGALGVVAAVGVGVEVGLWYNSTHACPRSPPVSLSNNPRTPSGPRMRKMPREDAGPAPNNPSQPTPPPAPGGGVPWWWKYFPLEYTSDSEFVACVTQAVGGNDGIKNLLDLGTAAGQIVQCMLDHNARK